MKVHTDQINEMLWPNVLLRIIWFPAEAITEQFSKKIKVQKYFLISYNFTFLSLYFFGFF